MEFLKKYWAQITAIITLLSGGATWAWDLAEKHGYNAAKIEINEKYNQPLIDAITYRSKYESCCAISELHD